MGIKTKSKNQPDKKKPPHPPDNRSRQSGTASQPKSGATKDTNQPTGQIDALQRIWQVVALIPKGKVASYGQVARLAGMPAHARYVGRAMGNLPKKTKLPWHRVVNAQLKIADRAGMELQKTRLEKEGIEFVGQRIPKGHHWDT